MSQSASLKLSDGRDLTHSCDISSLDIIGKWSVEVGCINFASHDKVLQALYTKDIVQW